jgi:hypothetical protein
MSGPWRSPWLFIAIVVGFFLLAFILGQLKCGKSTPSGARADSVLATDTVFVRDTLRQDSAIARLDSALAKQERAAKWWRDSVAKLERRGADLVKSGQAVDSADALRPGLTPQDSILRLTASRNIWRRAATYYAYEVVPGLKREVEMATTAKLTAIARGDTLLGQRNYARRRANEVTREFQDYRDATKEGIRLGPLTLPDWVDEAALVVGSVAVTCAVTC